MENKLIRNINIIQKSIKKIIFTKVIKHTSVSKTLETENKTKVVRR